MKISTLTAAHITTALFITLCALAMTTPKAHALEIGASSSAGVKVNEVMSDVKAKVQSSSSASSSINIDALVKAATLAIGSSTGSQATTTVMMDAEGSIEPASTDTSSNTEVTVTYNRPAKLFGFMSVTMKETAKVWATSDTETDVSVDRPWWAFLATTDSSTDDFESAIESRVASAGSIAVNGEFSADAKTRLVNDIRAAADVTFGVE